MKLVTIQYHIEEQDNVQMLRSRLTDITTMINRGFSSGVIAGITFTVNEAHQLSEQPASATSTQKQR